MQPRANRCADMRVLHVSLRCTDIDAGAFEAEPVWLRKRCAAHSRFTERRYRGRLVMAYNRLAVLVAISALLFAVPAYAQPGPSDVELAQMLRAGGYVIVLRAMREIG